VGEVAAGGSFTHEIAAFWPLRGPDNDHLVGEAALGQEWGRSYPEREQGFRLLPDDA